MSCDANLIAGRRVLLVEDEFLVAEEMRRGMEQYGVVVLGPVPSVDKAERLLATAGAIDGAVLDVNLQETMVFGLADDLIARAVPVVFVTGYDRATIPVRYADVKLCQKPVDPETVVAALFEPTPPIMPAPGSERAGGPGAGRG